MDKTQAQAALEQVRQFIKEFEDALSDRSGSFANFGEPLQALDQLSAYIEEQEKAVRVKVLEEVALELQNNFISPPVFPATTGEGGKGLLFWQILNLIEQKILEAKK